MKFGLKREEGTGDWRKFLNEELHGLYSTPNITRMIKSRRMGWAGHVVRIGRREIHTGLWSDKTEGDLLEELVVDWRIILKWLFKETGWETVHLINLANDREKIRAVVKVVMSLRVP
jgi:hypothetical protein